MATDFEHRSFAQELQLCQRYFQSFPKGSDGYSPIFNGFCSLTTRLQGGYTYPVEMRSAPTVATSGNLRILRINVAHGVSNIFGYDASPTAVLLAADTTGTMVQGQAGTVTRNNDASSKITLTAEL